MTDFGALKKEAALVQNELVFLSIAQIMNGLEISLLVSYLRSWVDMHPRAESETYHFAKDILW